MLCAVSRAEVKTLIKRAGLKDGAKLHEEAKHERRNNI